MRRNGLGITWRWRWGTIASDYLSSCTMLKSKRRPLRYLRSSAVHGGGFDRCMAAVSIGAWRRCRAGTGALPLHLFLRIAETLDRRNPVRAVPPCPPVHRDAPIAQIPRSPKSRTGGAPVPARTPQCTDRPSAMHHSRKSAIANLQNVIDNAQAFLIQHILSPTLELLTQQ
jgi:hypothetical protein